MGAIKLEDHDALRKWAAENRCEDPETLILRSEGGILYKNPHAMKAYKRITKMYRESLKGV